MINKLADWTLSVLLWNEERGLFIDKAIMTVIIAGTAFLMFTTL